MATYCHGRDWYASDRVGGTSRLGSLEDAMGFSRRWAYIIVGAVAGVFCGTPPLSLPSSFLLIL